MFLVYIVIGALQMFSDDDDDDDDGRDLLLRKGACREGKARREGRIQGRGGKRRGGERKRVEGTCVCSFKFFMLQRMNTTD